QSPSPSRTRRDILANVDADLTRLCEDGKQFALQTKRDIQISVACHETEDGTRSRKVSWRTYGTRAGEAAQAVLDAGAKPVREEDGVVWLVCPASEASQARLPVRKGDA